LLGWGLSPESLSFQPVSLTYLFFSLMVLVAIMSSSGEENEAKGFVRALVNAMTASLRTPGGSRIRNTEQRSRSPKTALEAEHSEVCPSGDKSDEIRFENENQEIHQMQRPAPDKFSEDGFVFPSPFDEGSRGRNDAVSGAIEPVESEIGLVLQPSVALFHSRKGLAPSFIDDEQLRQDMRDGDLRLHREILEVADFATSASLGRITSGMASSTKRAAAVKSAIPAYFAQDAMETVRGFQQDPSPVSPPSYPYCQADYLGMGSAYGGTELSTRQGRQNLENVTSRDAKQPM
jgi:hypothetical protein